MGSPKETIDAMLKGMGVNQPGTGITKRMLMITDPDQIVMMGEFCSEIVDTCADYVDGLCDAGLTEDEAGLTIAVKGLEMAAVVHSTVMLSLGVERNRELWMRYAGNAFDAAMVHLAVIESEAR